MAEPGQAGGGGGGLEVGGGPAEGGEGRLPVVGGGGPEAVGPGESGRGLAVVGVAVTVVGSVNVYTLSGLDYDRLGAGLLY